MTLLRDRPTGRRPSRTAWTPADQPEVRQVVHSVVAVAGVLSLGLRTQIYPGVTIPLLLGLIALPVTLGTLRSWRGARPIGLSCLLALISGAALVFANPYRHVFSVGNAVTQVALVATVPSVLFLVLWVRRYLTPGAIIAWYGVGSLLAVDPGSPLFASNPWKFGFSVPVALIALGITQMFGQRLAQVLVVLALSAVTVLSDARSGFGILVMTGVLLMWQYLPAPRNTRLAAARLVILASAFGWGIYSVAQQLILDGTFGSETQLRSRAQIEAGGSLLTGGRPELGATKALANTFPLGFGPGAIPSVADVHTAQDGMRAIGYDPENGYVYNYMFGGAFQLHSSIADLWAICGLGGLLLAGVVAFALIRGVALEVAARTSGAGVLFLVVRSVWNLGFSPLGGSLLQLVVALALVLPALGSSRRTGRGRTAPPPGRSRSASGSAAVDSKIAARPLGRADAVLGRRL